MKVNCLLSVDLFIDHCSDFLFRNVFNYYVYVNLLLGKPTLALTDDLRHDHTLFRKQLHVFIALLLVLLLHLIQFFFYFNL